METVELEGILIRAGANAVLISFVDASGVEREEWIPRSQISDQDWLDKDKKMITCNIPRWLAEDRGVV